MNNVDKILNSSPSLGALNQAVDLLERKIDALVVDMQKDISFINKLLGENLDKVFGLSIPGFVDYSNSEYTLENKDFIINVKAITANNNPDVATYKQIEDFLDAYLQNENLFESEVEKNNLLTNAMSVSEIATNKNAISKNTDIYVKDCLLDMKGKIDEQTCINQNYFINNFYTKRMNQEKINFSISGEQGINEFETITINNTTFKELLLDYTLKELEGSGCKLSDFEQTQAAVEPTSGVYEIYVNVMAPQAMTLTVNGQNFSYTPSMDDDTPDVVADTLGGDIESIDGVTHDIDTGYYSATPKDDDNEYKLSWYAKDTSDGKSYHVTLQEDNSSEHDLEVSWDSDKGTLTVTYASDGSDPEYPTIGELIDAVANANTPITAVLVDPNYTTDDDYPYDLDFDLDQYDSKLILTSTKQSLDISTPQPSFFGINTQQEYVDGKHQAGDVEVETFRRGYKYYIKVDNEEIDVDTTDDNNPDVTNANSLVKKFVTLLSNDSKVPFEVTSNSNKVSFVSKDYNSHTITTSGAIDYNPPKPRTVSVKNDLKSFVIQGEEVFITKDAATDLSKINTQTPIAKQDIANLNNNNFFASDSVASNIFLSDASFNLSQDLIKMNDIYDVIEEMEAINPNMFPKGTFTYISIYDMELNCDINIPDSYKVERYFILQAPDNSFIPKEQIDFFEYLDLKNLQENFLGLGDESFSAEIDIFGSFFKKEEVLSLKKLRSTKRPSVLESPFSKENISEPHKVLTTLIPGGSTEELKKYNEIAPILIRNDGNMLSELIAVLDKYKYNPDDIRWTLEYDVMRNVVLEMDTDDSVPSTDDGLTGASADGEVGFKDLYIREYKKIYKNEYESTNLSEYFKFDINKLSDLAKAVIILGAQKIQEKANLSFAEFTDEAPILPRATDLFIFNPYDFLIYKDIVRTGYFPANIDAFASKVGNGRIYNGDTIWNLLIKAITFKDESTVSYVGDSWSTLKILFNKFKTRTSWEVAFMLGQDISLFKKVSSTSKEYNIKTQISALDVLFSKIYAYIKENNISSDKYEDTFNKLVGLLFVNDNTATNILPYTLFGCFVDYIENTTNNKISGDLLNLPIDFRAYGSPHPIIKNFFANSKDNTLTGLTLTLLQEDSSSGSGSSSGS